VRRDPTWRTLLDQMRYLKRFRLAFKNRVPVWAAFTYCVQSCQIQHINDMQSGEIPTKWDISELFSVPY
jgi:hypothetical protein